MKKMFKLFLMCVLFLSSCSADNSNTSTTDDSSISTTSSLYGEKYWNVTTPDYYSSIDLPYFDDEEIVQVIACVKTPYQFTANRISYLTEEHADKSKQIFKDKKIYKNTKESKKEIYGLASDVLCGYSSPFIVYNDNYYFVLNYQTYYDEKDNFTKSNIFVSSLFYMMHVEIQRSVNQFNYYYYGIPFPYYFENRDKMDVKTGNREYEYSYEELNSNCLLVDANFKDYASIKEYYQSVRQEYVESYDDENKTIKLKTYDFENYTLEGRYVYIKCNDTGIKLIVDMNSYHYTK